MPSESLKREFSEIWTSKIVKTSVPRDYDRKVVITFIFTGDADALNSLGTVQILD
jgi:hypothetical protein